MGRVTLQRGSGNYHALKISFLYLVKLNVFFFSNVLATVALIRALSRVKNNNVSKVWKSKRVYTRVCV